MKLLEKMATKSMLLMDGNPREDAYPWDYGLPYTDGYVAGFRAAREMAIELTTKPAWITVRDMPKLGEEEV